MPDERKLREDYQYVKWMVVNDGRSSWQHVELLKCGISGCRVFHVDDPILAGWWNARRKHLRPCRCDTIAIYKADAKKIGMTEVVFAPQPAFDPWDTMQNCELLGWGSGHRMGWPDADYLDHPGNPDRSQQS